MASTSCKATGRLSSAHAAAGVAAPSPQQTKATARPARICRNAADTPSLGSQVMELSLARNATGRQGGIVEAPGCGGFSKKRGRPPDALDAYP